MMVNPMADPKKDKKPNIHAGHRERLRTRYRKCGFDNFQQHEILELLLFRAIPRANTNPIAHELLNRFGSLYDTIYARRDDLLEVDGVGPKSADVIREAADLARAAKLQEIASAPLTSWDRLFHYTTEWFGGKLMGTVAVMLLDARRMVISVDILAEEHLRRPVDYADAITALCEKYRAPNVVLMHNHADGVLIPSVEDLDLTKSIYDVLAERSITLLEHVIVWKLNAVPCLDLAVQKEVSAFPLKHTIEKDYNDAYRYIF